MKLVDKVQIQQHGCCLEEDSIPKASVKNSQGVSQLETFSLGYDELNLAEFPLSAIADRHPSGEKTTILTDCDSPRLTDTIRAIFHATIPGAFSVSYWSGVL